MRKKGNIYSVFAHFYVVVAKGLERIEYVWGIYRITTVLNARLRGGFRILRSTLPTACQACQSCAALIKQGYASDPIRYPTCDAEMKTIAFSSFITIPLREVRAAIGFTPSSTTKKWYASCHRVPSPAHPLFWAFDFILSTRNFGGERSPEVVRSATAKELILLA